MKKIMTTITILAFATIGFSQNLTRTVISDGGGYAEAGNYLLSFTIGEEVVGEKTSGSFMLTQGFQQGNYKEKNTDTTAIRQIELKVKYALYPNPSIAHITLELSAENNFELEAYILDATGKIASKNKKLTGNNIQTSWDISSLNSGSYFIQLSKNKEVYKSIKFIKQ